ncbi:MAG: hypothetical protein ABSA44_02600 [Bacteroidota bacterium]|jgi:Spy/CpxP family protein refolding chaperone
MQAAIKRLTVAFVLIIGVLILLSTVAQAQPQRMSVKERVKILKDTLKLNDEQTMKITTILEDQREEITTAMNDNRGDRNAMHAVMQEIMKKTDDKIKEVLTEDQASKYDEMLKAQRAKMNRRKQESNKQ